MRPPVDASSAFPVRERPPVHPRVVELQEYVRLLVGCLRETTEVLGRLVETVDRTDNPDQIHTYGLPDTNQLRTIAAQLVQIEEAL